MIYTKLNNYDNQFTISKNSRLTSRNILTVFLDNFDSMI